MENLEHYQNTSEYRDAVKNWEEKGSLGVTAQDHEAIGSTPDEILLQNPGKTLGELMSEQEIKEFIEGTRKNILENEEFKNMEEFNEELKQNLKITVEYLRDIGKLPENFT